MTTAKDIEEGLFDADGSVRNITFMPVSQSGIPSLMADLREYFTVHTATDSNGEDIRPQINSAEVRSILDRDSDYILSYWSSECHMIAEIQAFVSWPEHGQCYFVELTFNPRDLIRERFNLGHFADTVERWAEMLGSEDYFVRYENASWNWFDGKAPDVIYTRKTNPMHNKSQ